MRNLYTKTAPGATAQRNPTLSLIHGSTFAEEAVGEAFRGRDLSLAREPGFRDRPANRKPKRLGEIIESVTADAARKAVRYWLREAAAAPTESARREALSIAGKIAKAAGLDWPEDRAA